MKQCGDKGAYATITLNRPGAKNALNKTLSAELASALDKARKDEGVKCVIITGAGQCFSAGVDLKDPFFADVTLMRKDRLDSPANYIWQLQHVEVPIIAAVAGPCITGGMEIALNCDIILASPSAMFRDTHTVYGIVPGVCLPSETLLVLVKCACGSRAHNPACDAHSQFLRCHGNGLA